MKIYDFDIEDEISKVETNLQNVEVLKNSFADHIVQYRKFSENIDLDLKVLSECIESYERALLIGVYTYAEQLVKNFYYELLEKDRTQSMFINNFINNKLDIEKFSPNVKYELLEKNIKNELVPKFRFIIKKDRDEIEKYDDIINDRHRYAHRGIYQSNFGQYQDVINAEKYITLELKMVVDKGKDYRLEYQNQWKEIGDILKECCGLYTKLKKNPNKNIKKAFIAKVKILRAKVKKFYMKYIVYINDCLLLDEVKEQFFKLIDIDLRKASTYSIVEDLSMAIREGKIFIG